MRTLSIHPAPDLQEASQRVCPQRRCRASSLLALSRWAGARLLQTLCGVLIKTLGQPAEQAPAEVHRAFHRGASLVVTNPRRIEWTL